MRRLLTSELMRHDVCCPLDVEVDQNYNLACPANQTQATPDMGG
jgi:hypothetical protein